MTATNDQIIELLDGDGRQHALAMYELLGHMLCGITELRSLGKKGPCVAYVDNAASFIDLATGQNLRGDHVYVGLQPRPTALAQSALNTWKPAPLTWPRGNKHNLAPDNDLEWRRHEDL